MPTRVTVTHTGHYLTPGRIAYLFAEVMLHHRHERLETESRRVVAFVLHDTVLQISLRRFYNLVTSKDPLAEMYVNGQPYSLRIC